MSKKFVYQTQALGSWTETNPQQALLNLLQPMVATLKHMEADGSLKSMLCEIPVPYSDPFWVENAAQCADAAFRKDALEKADAILTRLSTKSANSKIWRKMARLGAVRGPSALAFERHFWVMLVNYSFQRAAGIPRVGQQPKIFIGEAVNLLKAYVRGTEGFGDCPHCNLVAERFDDLFSPHHQTRY